MKKYLIAALLFLSAASFVQAQEEIDPQNKIAILPFTYIDVAKPGPDAVGRKLQQDAHRIISKSAGKFIILDLKTTTALLDKAKINSSNIGTFTMKQLAEILNVGYVLDGRLTAPDREVQFTTKTVTKN